MIKKFLLLLYRPFIHLWLYLYKIKNYTINKDNTVDVNGSVYLNFYIFLFFIPIQFGKVDGNFICSYSKIFSLKGCPKIVHGDFNCSSTKIKTLIGSPNFVGGSYNCSDNLKLKTLKGCPQFIGNDFSAIVCNIETLEYSPLEVGNDIFLSGNPIIYLEGFDTVFGGKFEFFSKKFKILEIDHFYVNENTLTFSYDDMKSVEISNNLDEKLTLKDEKIDRKKVKI